MEMIKTEKLTKTYNGVNVVDGLDLVIEAGEVFGFIGPNGAGKTTTLGMMIGEIEPTSGKCLVGNVDVTRNPLQAKQITGYLPDGVGFYGNLTARQNLKYFSRFYDMKDADADKRISDLLDYVGLGKVEKPTSAYSRGMKQRLGIAQALLNDPQVIFLDEPTNGLDPQGVVQFRNIIKDISKQGKTVFFSSHLLEEVRHVCNTIGIISKGKIIAHGTPDEVRRKMAKDDNVTIIVKVIGEMPKLSDPGIIEAQYLDGSAVIKASSDIRNSISEELYQKGLRVTELRLEERMLEDVFLETVYGGN